MHDRIFAACPAAAGDLRALFDRVRASAVSRAGAACCRPRYLSIQRLNYLWTVWHSSARIQVTCSHSVTADYSLADHGLGGAHHLGHGLRGGRGTPRRWRLATLASWFKLVAATARVCRTASSVATSPRRSATPQR
jgi:hypothetical protein